MHTHIQFKFRDNILNIYMIYDRKLDGIIVVNLYPVDAKFHNLLFLQPQAIHTRKYTIFKLF